MSEDVRFRHDYPYWKCFCSGKTAEQFPDGIFGRISKMAGQIPQELNWPFI